MYDFVCVFSYEYEMPVGLVTKHNVAVLMPSFALLLHFSLCLFFLPNALCNNITKIPHNQGWWVFYHQSYFDWLFVVMYCGRTDPLVFRQCFDLAQRQAVALPISCSQAGTVGLNNRGSLSLHILSKLPHELHAGLRRWWWSCVALYGQ